MKSLRDDAFIHSLAAPILAILSGAVVMTAVGCSRKSSEAPPPATITPPPPAGSPMAGAPPAAPMGSGTAAATPAPAPQFEPPTVVQGFSSPESVLYDATADVYLVSNVEGPPDKADKNGFISKVSPEGKVAELKWIGTGLNAPKGMTISNGTLYVSDINWIKLFDEKTGKAKGKIGVPGSTFLNDIAVAPDGTIYVSDSGVKVGANGFEPTGTDAVFKIGKRGEAVKLIADRALGRPNGLLPDAGGTWVVTLGTGELYYITKDGKRERSQTIPGTSLDGIVALSDGSILVSDWNASAVWRGVPGGSFEKVLTDVKSPADIGFDTKRNALLIPGFMTNEIRIQKLPALPPLAAPPAPAAAPAAAMQPASSSPTKSTSSAPAAPAGTAPSGTGSKPGATPATAAQPAMPAPQSAASPKPAQPATPAAPAQPATTPSPTTPASMKK